MLDRDTTVMFILPELFRGEGGIQRIGQDMLEAFARIKHASERLSVVVANDGPESALPASAFAAHYDFTWCGRPRALRKARVALNSASIAAPRSSCAATSTSRRYATGSSA